MPDLTDDEQKQVLGEVLHDQLKAIQESLADVPKRDEFRKVEEKVDAIHTKLDTTIAVVKEHSTQLDDHETRITSLEAA